MGKVDKLLSRVLSSGSEANIRFRDLCNLLRGLGFEERIRGSHHLFTKPGVEELINLQRDGDKVRPYQVRQVRRILGHYGFGSTD